MAATPPPTESLDDTLKNIDWSKRPLKTQRDSTGTLTLQFENDTFADKSDNNFTAGFGFAWTSAAVGTLSPKNWFRNRIEDEFSFFPTVSNPSYRKFVQLSLNYEMYTANDISDPDPPPIPTPAISCSTPPSTRRASDRCARTCCASASWVPRPVRRGCRTGCTRRQANSSRRDGIRSSATSRY